MINSRIRSKGYTYRELAIIPRIPKKNFKDIDIGVTLAPNLQLKKPFISSPMDTVTNGDSAIKLGLEGALGILHYNYRDVRSLLQEVQKVKAYKTDNAQLPVGVLVKCDVSSILLISELVKLGVDLVAIDSLHSAPDLHIDVLKRIKDKFPDLTVMSGNVVHPDDCLEVISNGASVLRIGYSAASINDGKSMFGTGAAQATAVYECSVVARENGVKLVADGGLGSLGDIALAFALGADCVMLGRMFASSYDTPGTVFLDEDNHKKKIYRGMSRRGLIDQDMLAEGKECILNADSSVVDILRDMDTHLKMSISRAGSISLSDFQENADIQFLTEQAIKELEPK